MTCSCMLQCCVENLNSRYLGEITLTLIEWGYGPHQLRLVGGGLIKPLLKAFAKGCALLPVVASFSFESPTPSGGNSIKKHLVGGTTGPIWLESTLSSVQIKLWFNKSFLGVLLNEVWYNKVLMITFGIPSLINKDTKRGGESRNITQVLLVITKVFVQNTIHAHHEMNICESEHVGANGIEREIKNDFKELLKAITYTDNAPCVCLDCDMFIKGCHKC